MKEKISQSIGYALPTNQLDLPPLNRSRYNVVVFGLKEKGDLNGQKVFQT